MPTKKKLVFRNVLLCGHASQSERRKYTLVNIFAGDDIYLSNFPGGAMFGLYVEVIPDKDTPAQIVVDLLIDGEPKVKFGFQMDTYIPGQVAVMLAPSFPIQLEAPARVLFRASAEGFQASTIMEKRFTLDPALTNASPPPSSQSPSASSRSKPSPEQPRPSRRGRPRAVRSQNG